jgi:hypothetical protein
MSETMLLLLCMYFLPTIVALSRRHPDKGMVFVLNLFFGWTFVGWVISLAKAASATKTYIVVEKMPAR